MSKITLRGAYAHNLKHIDLDLPHGQWIALTGLSGSGKTTLATEVLHREGRRRYLGALSPKARQHLGKMGHAQVDHLSGLPVTLATGQGSLTPHARSTVGTLVGLLDLLRLLYARVGTHPHVALTRAHFSFNDPAGACPACKGLGVEDLVDPQLLVADASKSIREGALVPTLASGYTVYSQVTLEVMNTICQAHGFDVHTPWADLTDDQRHIIFFGSRALKVPFGKHGLESRMKWEGITAKPREEGYYRGLVPVIEETLTRNRNPNILRFVRSVPCSTCGGTRLGPVGRTVRVGPHTLPELLAAPIHTLPERLDSLGQHPVVHALRPQLDRRIGRMLQLSLGHLTLGRTSTSLSGGEGQRLRLAAQLNARLGGQLVVLDEPTLGLHPEAQEGMAAIMGELRDLGNTLLVVDHDPHMVARAQHWVNLGPGSGPDGGEVTFAGPLPGEALRYAYTHRSPREATGRFTLRGATLHNLKNVDLTVPLGVLTVVSGPSGAGKSSLVFQTLLPALTGHQGGPFHSLHDVPSDLRVQWVDARPIGKTSRSTPATYTGMFDHIRKIFAATPQAKAAGLTASHFSYNAKAGRCPDCEGLGTQRIGLHLLDDVIQPCPSCQGSRYAPHVLAVRWNGLTIAQALHLSVDEALETFQDIGPLAAMCHALSELGLGYLHLGQPSGSLSRGEAQRVRLATVLGKAPKGPSLLLLDEPDRGLHPDDVRRLLDCLHGLVDAGHTVLAVSHHPMVWQAADQRIALRDGRRAQPSPLPQPPAPKAVRPSQPPSAISLRGVRTHNLKNLDVRIPHGRITAITGVSGSGKSSLAYDTLAALSWTRFAESLPFHVRRFVRQLPPPDVASADGLTPVIALRQDAPAPGRRATVGTQSSLDEGLRLLWSRLGTLDGRPAGLSQSHFSANQTLGACPACMGLGTVQRCDPERLILHPHRALGDGAMAGTKPGEFFGDPHGQYIHTLKAAADAAGLDVSLPFQDLSEPARHLALHGAGEQTFEVTWSYQRGKRSGTHTFHGPWPGLLALVEHEARLRAKRKNGPAWEVPLTQRPCPACDGERLNPHSRRVQMMGHSLPEWARLPLTALHDTLTTLPSHPVLDAVRPRLLARLATLDVLGLSHLHLARTADSLSSGELQRLRLAEVLDSELTQLTLVLDEPGTGLDAPRLHQLSRRLETFCQQGNTVVLVSHREPLIQAAHKVLTLGPGAGEAGGQWVSPPVRRPLPGPLGMSSTRQMHLQGAHAHNLKGFDLCLPTAGLVAVTGPSGSGKTTLTHDVLAASALAGRPVGCRAVQGLPPAEGVVVARQVPRRTPLSTLALLKPLQALFHGVGSGLPRSAFSFHSAAGRCPTCKGSGVHKVAMDAMADLVLPCPACGGQRYKPEVLAVRWNGASVADVLKMPVADLAPLLPEGALKKASETLTTLGLGHLSLGRRQLSGGEHRRVLLAQALLATQTPRLLVLDEPGGGLQREDLRLLIQALHALAERGALVVYTTHLEELVEVANERVRLGPGGGEQGGSLVGG